TSISRRPRRARARPARRRRASPWWPPSRRTTATSPPRRARSACTGPSSGAISSATAWARRASEPLRQRHVPEPNRLLALPLQHPVRRRDPRVRGRLHPDRPLRRPVAGQEHAAHLTRAGLLRELAARPAHVEVAGLAVEAHPLDRERARDREQPVEVALHQV